MWQKIPRDLGTELARARITWRSKVPHVGDCPALDILLAFIHAIATPATTSTFAVFRLLKHSSIPVRAPKSVDECFDSGGITNTSGTRKYRGLLPLYLIGLFADE
jgi:hypothetical protein